MSFPEATEHHVTASLMEGPVEIQKLQNRQMAGEERLQISFPVAIAQDVTAPVTDSPDESLSLQNSVRKERPSSPVPSCLSMRTDLSMNVPLNFKDEDLLWWVQPERAYSPTSTCMYSDSVDPDENVRDKTPNSSCARPGEVACDFCLEKKERAVKSCLACAASYCETHIRQHYTVPVLQKHKLVETSGDLEGRNSQQNVEDWITKALPPPQNIKFCPVGPDFVFLSWDEPEGLAEQIKHFIVTWSDGRSQHSLKVKRTTKIKIEGLRPGNKYVFKVATVGNDDRQSAYASASVHTAKDDLKLIFSMLYKSNWPELGKEVPAPDNLFVEEVDTRSFTVKWNKPNLLEQTPHHYLISSTCPQAELIYTTVLKKTFSDLEPGTIYTVKVATVLENGEQSQPTSEHICTAKDDYDLKLIFSMLYEPDWPELGKEVPAPDNLFVEEVHTRSFTIKWNKPNLLEQTPHHYLISSTCPQAELVYTTGLKKTFSDFEPDTFYTVKVATVLENGEQKMPLEALVSHLGMMDYLKGKKLSLTTVLEINEKSINHTDNSIQSLSSKCWCFLRKLFRVNVMARDVTFTNDSKPKGNSAQDSDQDWEDLLEPEASDNNINPLDLITALFLCSDGLLQQEMALKMSMCQFSVPLLLPNCDSQQCTLMLWALRDIVKSYTPHSLQESRGFVEDSIVLMDLPMISFVRLGRTSLSKSHILNQVFSNPLQYHDTFVHHNKKNENIPRKISNGMVEISWYLPGGNSDIFPEPLAVANLRGDISAHQTGFNFLCQTSAAMFVFIDDLGENINLLKPQDSKAQIFLVCNKNFDMNKFKNKIHDKFKKSFIVMKGSQMNDAEFVNRLRSAISRAVSSDCAKMSIEKMSTVARELQILVDEDHDLCQKAKQKASAITDSISDIPKYKEKQLPLQGDILKKLAKHEKEECRLKNRGLDIQMYRSELDKKKQELRKQQVTKDITPAISMFISGLSVCKEERSYFLKWLRINLDNISRKLVLKLQQDYKKACENYAANKDCILKLDNQMSCSSLDVTHFLRELGQHYESASSIPEHPDSKQKMQDIKELPKMCAELMLEGFPLELVDGDASYIPLKWVSAVLNELQSMEKNPKIRVITVLGVQSTGKSTLLNTMFGVQFAVSSGRCTRGAFMLLVRVSEDFREQLGCDFIMVIDTEGLRSPALTQLADSYEHDNELATLVVGLSDLTIINIAMENSTETQDILQIVIHTFLRMDEVGKKPHCQFVHQNVPDVAAHDKNMSERKILLDQLDTITQAAARMEGKNEVKKFTDIIEYSDKDSFYIPSLWQGTPPMAPVNADYSQSVVRVKKCIVDIMVDLKKRRPAQTVEEFYKWTSSLWKAVKYENFIFSFRNSMVAEAYSKLCEQYNKWDWDFRREMREWMVKAETKVLNFRTVTQIPQPAENIEDFVRKQRNEANLELGKAEQQLNGNLAEYFRKTEKHVYLVERYRQDFSNSIKGLRQETFFPASENKIMRRLEELLRIAKGRSKMMNIKENQAKVMEERVSVLLEKCRKSEHSFSDDQLDKEFEQMWSDVVKELQFKGIEEQNVSEDIYQMLHKDLENRGSSAMQILAKVNNLVNCGTGPFTVEVNFTEKNLQTFGINFRKKILEIADNLIKKCCSFINSKVSQTPQMDYDSTYVREMLIMINGYIDDKEPLYTNIEVQTNLKIHICGIAAREFKQMHKNFIRDNDPLQCLEKDKDQYCIDFKDLYHKRDQAQREAKEFTKQCLEPAVRKYVSDYLGSDILDKMKSGARAIKFSTRSFFQYSILKQLLEDHEFQKFLKFVGNYERFAKDWIVAEIKTTFSKEDCKLSSLEIQRLEEIVGNIKAAIPEARKTSEGNMEDQPIHHFIDNIHKYLNDKLIISPVTFKVQILNNATTEQFSKWLISCVDDMKQSLISEFQKDVDISAKLEKLPLKPQDELFSKMFGCGEMCPFCKVPCEAGGDKHEIHHASIHRPEGIGGCGWFTSQKLVTDICSHSVASQTKFRNSKTNGEWVPYKEYRSLYPEWKIQADTSIEATDYWKYVFAQFSDQFAKEYDKRPAELPLDWPKVTKEDAMKCLDKEFMFE